jgi:hypothetical protein
MAEVMNTQTFNGPLEAGVRAVALLTALYPRSYDLQRMTALDYLLLRTHELGGPPDLHPAAPIRSPATEVRRRLIESALMLMMSRGLVEREVSSSGIRYLAGEVAAPFLDATRSLYLRELRARAEWLASLVEDYEDDDFDELMKNLFDDWVAEFHSVERSSGVEE